MNFKKLEHKPLDTDQIVAKYRKHCKHKKIFLILCGVCLVILGTAYWFIHPVYQQVADNVYKVLADMDESVFLRAGNTIIYDANEQVIGKIGNEKYEYAGISEISDYIQQGYIAKEDRRFTTHHGVDFKGTARAAFELLKNRGEITQGGSTITQQVVKNNLLSQKQNYIRKLTEMFLAFKIEKDYTKAEIMEFYCNSNYYGNGCYGVEGASEYYFGKKASAVTLAEAAILVATSNSPNKYNPVADYALAMEKKQAVLDDMLECGYITQKEYDAAAAEQPEIVQKSENVKNESYLISYAIHCAALDVMAYNDFTFQYTFQSGDEYKEYAQKYDAAYNKAVEEVRTGGYSIYTSLDQNAQKYLQAAVDQGLAEFTEKSDEGIYTLQGAAVCVDNTTGMIIAVVGGREEQGSFNRGYQAVRQPGSCIKPLLDYGPALNEGNITASSVLVDEKTTVDGYSPNNVNDTYMGPVTAREAVVRSLNTVALQVMNKTGINTCMSYLDKLHFSTLTYADMIAPATSIGGFTSGITVADMAKGYAVLANGGRYTENTCIKALKRYDEKVIYKAVDDVTEVYSEDTAFILSDIMEGLFKQDYGSGYGRDTAGQHYAGKTGSTNNKKDAWFCGYSAHYSAAVWVGYDKPKDLGFYGSSYPMSIWLNFMNTMANEKKLSVKEFAVPSTTKLTNADGALADVEYQSNIFASRPQGWDYVSSVALNKIEEKQREEENEKTYQSALAAVEQFEAYQITTMEQAEDFKEAYNEVYQTADRVEEGKRREDLMNRLAYKYELLNTDVLNTWNDVIKAYDEQVQQEKDMDNKLEAQKSLEQAQAKLKETRIDLVEYYIKELNKRTIYTSVVELLITNGTNALAECTSYDEYTSLSSRLNKAISYARNLPSQGTSSSRGTGSRRTPTVTQPAEPAAEQPEQTPDTEQTPVPDTEQVPEENDDTDNTGNEAEGTE